ncbi:MAG: cell division ATP-binding protein FtsE [Gammaproteobacteria bacterium]|jgi:cell division transport system ATP-binding protein|nr:cell division ATP-binding protein FtsE [Gammaproteobacteria bacterium]
MITLDRVSKRYSGGQDALANLSVSLGRGEFAFVTGHSGAGKSTLLRLVLGLEKASGGRLVVNGRELGALSARDLPAHRREIGTVFQDHQLLNDRSVFDNVALPLEISGLDPRESQRRVRAALDKVGLLAKEKANPMALSGGEQQRVGIARAVVNTPRIILADEPTGNLDPELSAEIMALFAQFRSVGVCLLVASHDRTLIDELGYRTLTLEQGRLVDDSSSRRDKP